MSQTENRVSFEESGKPQQNLDPKVGRKDSLRRSDQDVGRKDRSETAPAALDPANNRSPRQRSGSVVDQAREFLTWTMNDVFDWNPEYLQRLRGVLHIIEVVFTLLTVILIGAACQLKPFSESGSLGFCCKSPDTFLFAVACSSFLSSLLFLVCCVLSKKTESRLYSTSFEISYYVLYCSLFLVSSITLMSNAVSRNSEKSELEEGYRTTLAAAVFGLITCLVYAMSAVWFCVYHRVFEKQESE